MFSKEVYQVILDGFDGIAYLADIETHELIYINKKLASYLKIGNDYSHKKCYELLQGINAPCSFCTNHLISTRKTHNWERYHPRLKRFFELKDSIVEIEGRKIRLEFGIDVTHIKKYVDAIEQNYSKEQILVNCAKVLRFENNLDYAVSTILEQLILFFNADRAYIFEYDKDINELVATHVYVKPQVKSFRNILSAVAQKELQEWLYQFLNESDVSLQYVETDLEFFPELYEAFSERDIENLFIFPLYNEDKFLGIIGLDNVRANIKEKELLKTIALFIIDNLQKIKMINKLNYLSEIDELAGVYNRNKFNSVVYELREQKKNFGIIYIDVNGLKKINDTLGHKKGDELLQNVCSFLKKHFPKQIYRIGGDEFVIILRNISEKDFNNKINKFFDMVAHEKSFSLSIGEYYCNGEFIDEALHKADQIMFERKRQFYNSL